MYVFYKRRGKILEESVYVDVLAVVECVSLLSYRLVLFHWLAYELAY